MNCQFCSNEDLINVPEIAVNMAVWECRQCCVSYFFYIHGVFGTRPFGYELMARVFRPDDFDCELREMLDDWEASYIAHYDGRILLKLDCRPEGINPNNAKTWMIRLLNLRAFQ